MTKAILHIQGTSRTLKSPRSPQTITSLTGKKICRGREEKRGHYVHVQYSQARVVYSRGARARAGSHDAILLLTGLGEVAGGGATGSHSQGPGRGMLLSKSKFHFRDLARFNLASSSASSGAWPSPATATAGVSRGTEPGKSTRAAPGRLWLLSQGAACDRSTRLPAARGAAMGTSSSQRGDIVLLATAVVAVERRLVLPPLVVLLPPAAAARLLFVGLLRAVPTGGLSARRGLNDASRPVVDGGGAGLAVAVPFPSGSALSGGRLRVRR